MANFIPYYSGQRMSRRAANFAKARKAKFDAWIQEDVSRVPLMIQLRARQSNSFFGSLVDAIDTFGALTERQEAAARSALERAKQVAEQNKDSTWIGQLGDKVTLEATVDYARQVSGPYGTSYLNQLRVGPNIVVAFAKQPFGESGATVTISGVVKNHSDRNDVKQTVLTRVKQVA